MNRKIIFSLIFVLAAMVCVSAEQNATIQGNVVDEKTGTPFSNVLVEIFDSQDPSTPVASVYTDSKGYYEASVPSERNYDIYVRLGDKNPKQSVYVRSGQIQGVKFSISMESISQQDIIEQPYFWVIVIIAVLVIGVILFDEFVMRKKKITSLETEKDELKEKIDSTVELDEMSVLEKKRDRINLMVKMAQLKFHKRQLDEESFREIVRDKQKELIEIEARITEIKKKKEGLT